MVGAEQKRISLNNLFQALAGTKLNHMLPDPQPFALCSKSQRQTMMIGNDKANRILAQGLAMSIELGNEKWPNSHLSLPIQLSNIEYGIAQRFGQSARQGAICAGSPVGLDNPARRVETKEMLEAHGRQLIEIADAANPGDQLDGKVFCPKIRYDALQGQVPIFLVRQELSQFDERWHLGINRCFL